MNLKVEATFTDGFSIYVRRGEVEADGTAAAVRRACERGLPFLRRSELLAVLSSRPGERFRYFESFLGLEDSDDAVKKMADLKSTKERRSTELKSRQEAEIEALRPLLVEPGEHLDCARSATDGSLWTSARCASTGCEPHASFYE